MKIISKLGKTGSSLGRKMLNKIGLARIWVALAVVTLLVGAASLGFALYATLLEPDSAGPSGRESVVNRGGVDDLPTSEGLPTSTVAPVPQRTTPPGSTVFAGLSPRLLIGRIGVNAPVVELGVDTKGAPEVPLNAYEVAWYNFSAQPGGGSNAVFAAHVTWARGPAVFEKLEELEEGDVIKFATILGKEFVYEVSRKLVVAYSDPVSLEALDPTPVDSVTLFTCGGKWTSDPRARFGGNYSERVIVEGRLVRITEPPNFWQGWRWGP